MSKGDTGEVALFFPYYINQGRLLDIYAILNEGYSEYSEITTAISNERIKSGKLEASFNGFKLFNFGTNMSGKIDKTDNNTNENKEKKIQTVTSVLSIVNSCLANKGYLHDIREAAPGQFVCLPVVLSINSIKSLLSEMADLLKLSENMQKVGVDVKGIGKNTNSINNILKNIQVLFDGEEILYQTDDYAIIGNILDSNLYQSVRADLIGTELTCLAQVKRVFPGGTELMKNTIFTKIKDNTAKQKLIDSVQQIAKGNIFDFEAIAVTSIQNKPVYQLEIIALYQQ
ncbi:DUF6414 family protein [Zongyangia hominis]|uniref:Uncharacterized protein n=1 Tax=Zongyangia hominis TaxID=2763677 RepID=A0A926EGD2_9FIRM|nr:hypothetical protein [Zongyangia hominis]MBC8571331.1 hypothetical protein [Zongyangia hominis]